MLKIINNLTTFFQDNYRRIHVRKYAKLINVSPPTASKILKDYNKQKILKKTEEMQYFYYFPNKENNTFIDLSRIYWKLQLKELLEFLENELINPVIILFGSLSKGEAKKDSDIDIAIFSPSKKELKLQKFEHMLNRKIQIFKFSKQENVKNKDLLANILNGYIMKGRW